MRLALHLSCRRFAVTLLAVATTLIISIYPGSVLAHDDFSAQQSLYQIAYAEFLSGIRAVTINTPVLLGLIAAGLFSGIWKPFGLRLSCGRPCRVFRGGAVDSARLRRVYCRQPAGRGRAKHSGRCDAGYFLCSRSSLDERDPERTSGFRYSLVRICWNCAGA